MAVTQAKKIRPLAGGLMCKGDSFKEPISILYESPQIIQAEVKKYESFIKRGASRCRRSSG
jgi:hypothetical protein